MKNVELYILVPSVTLDKLFLEKKIEAKLTLKVEDEFRQWFWPR